VRFTLDGKLQGSYPFTVRAGKIEVQGKQRDDTPALDRITDYLYGGKYRSWWLPRESGAAIAR
jgi:hypothetical protein